MLVHLLELLHKDWHAISEDHIMFQHISMLYWLERLPVHNPDWKSAITVL